MVQKPSFTLDYQGLWLNAYVILRPMKLRLKTEAFTIVEVMIVLAVSSALLISAIAVISGQQQKTQFSQAIRDIESQIRDTINDVAHGFYHNPGNFICTSTGGGPLLTAGTNNQGTNKDCIFIGRIIQFALSGSNGEAFNIYNLIGQRQVNGATGARDVTNLNEAQPTALAPSSSSGANFPDATEEKTLSYGLKASTMQYISGSVSTDIGAVGFVSSLANFEGGNILSGTQSISLMPIAGTALDMTAPAAVDAINNLNNNSPVNPDGGVSICFQSGGTDQKGVIVIGSNGRELSTNLTITPGTCS